MDKIYIALAFHEVCRFMFMNYSWTISYLFTGADKPWLLWSSSFNSRQCRRVYQSSYWQIRYIVCVPVEDQIWIGLVMEMPRSRGMTPHFSLLLNMSKWCHLTMSEYLNKDTHPTGKSVSISCIGGSLSKLFYVLLFQLILFY